MELGAPFYQKQILGLGAIGQIKKRLHTALRSMEYDKESMTANGFIAMARTMFDEEFGYPIEHIEHQLAHTVRDSLDRAYNRASYLKQRREMLKEWADFLIPIEVITLNQKQLS